MAPSLDDRRSSLPAQQSLFPEARVASTRPASAPLRPSQRADTKRLRRDLWLAIELESLPLQVFHQAALAETAQAVIEEQGSTVTVVAVNAMAESAGVVPGMSLAAAWSLLPDLAVQDRDAAREAVWLRRLAWWAHRFTSQVALDGAGLLLEVRGSLRLFGGGRALLRRVRQGLDELGVKASLAMAPTPRAARWLSRVHDGVLLGSSEALPGKLGCLPLAATDLPLALQQRLQRMGVQRVADALRLPRDAFARRFGKSSLAMLDQALGRQPDLRTSLSLPARFRSQLDLVYEISDAPVLLHPAMHLLEELATYLHVTQQGVRGLRFTLLLRDRSEQSFTVGFARRLRSLARMRALLEQQLENLRLEQPVRSISLEALSLESFAGEAASLFPNWQRQQQRQALVELLRARLGHDAVQGLSSRADHRPELAWHFVEPGGADVDLAPSLPRRPAWLLPEPERLVLRAGSPCYQGALELLAGPERIESGWWDGTDVQRDYFRARTRAGSLLWIFRDRRDRQWWLQGFFA